MQSNKHIWVFDFLRGLAVIGMIIFHFFFILSFFEIQNHNMSSGLWHYFGNLVRFTFIGLAGVSLSLSSHKKYSKIILRAFTIIFCGLIITLVTHTFFEQNTVRFGILHFIGTGMILALAFRKLKYTNLIIAVGIFLISFYLPHINNSNLISFVIGFPSNQIINDLDYFPLIPWLSLIFLGIFIGNSLKNTFITKLTSTPSIIKPINYMGSHSLTIYMLHVPILILIVSLFIGQNLFLPQY